MEHITVTDIRGNTKALEADYCRFIEEVDRVLGERPDYVGVTPYGSRLKGYDTPESDYDVFLIAGDSMLTTNALLSNEVKQIGLKYGRAAHAVNAIDASYFTANFASRERNAMYGHALYHLMYPYIGKQEVLQKFRRLARDRHVAAVGLGPEFANENINYAAMCLVIEDVGIQPVIKADKIVRYIDSGVTSRKIVERGFAPNGIEELARQRFEFWKSKILASLT